VPARRVAEILRLLPTRFGIPEANADYVRSADDPGYEKTRAVWFATGFRPLETLPLLWDPSNPALQLINSIAAERSRL
jgi:hypothetical protein